MRPKIDYNECLRDSPKFRKYLEEEEASIENLEQKLDRTLKLCTVMIDSGKDYVKNQSAFATSLWELHSHFKENKTAQNALNKIITCFQEMNKFQTILLDQASCIILKNITSFVKTEIKGVKEHRTHFTKVSETYDAALTRNAQANKNRPLEVNDAENTLSASSSCFRHIALDYVYTLTSLQSKKMHDILSTLLSYYQAQSTFYHQGYDLCNDYADFFKGLGNDITQMQHESNQLEKLMQDRHLSVSKFSEHQLQSNAISNLEVDVSGPEIPVTDPNRFEGYLFKRTSKGFKTWNRRWFYLRDNQLQYVKRDKDEEHTVMEEDLRICTVRPINDSDRRFCFEIISPLKSHILQADSAEIMNAWIAALHKRIDASIHDYKGKTQTDCNDPALGAKRIKKINCEQFYKIPGNDKCCDCRDTEPRWASINLGITLCIECSGVHRSLGVHYSKVRSLTLDDWEPEIVKVMMELGNDSINSIYEANYNDQSQIQRASKDCDTSIRETWIKHKYIDKTFVIPIAQLKNDKNTDKNCVLNNIVFSENGWTVRQLRKKRNKLRVNDSASSGSEHPIDTSHDSNELSFESDSTDDDGDEPLDQGMIEEKLDDFNSDRLLYKATTEHNLPVMSYALATGASKTWSNPNDLHRSPIHRAVLSNSVTLCEFLILNGFQINSVDENGYTPLHLATQKEYTALAYLLLKHQAKHNMVSKDGKLPIDIAVDQANADIVTLLRLTRLNEEIRMEEHGSGEGDTYTDVMNDFSRFAVSQPHKLQRSTLPMD